MPINPPLTGTPVTEATNTTPGTSNQIQHTREVYGVSKPQVSNIYLDDPKSWFYVIEAEFKSLKSCTDNTKYSTVIKALDSSTLKQIADILSNPPERNKYEAVKAAILDRVTASRQHEIRKLLTGMTLGDRKPSQLLREMKNIATDIVHKDVLHQFWLDCIPTDVRPFLVCSDNEDLETLAKVADRIIEARGPFVMAASFTPKVTKIDRPRTPGNHLERKVEELECLMASLVREIRTIRDQLNTNYQPDPPYHNRDYQNNHFNNSYRNRSRDRRPPHDANGVCYYRQKFGTSAHHCTTPCNFFKNVKPQEN